MGTNNWVVDRTEETAPSEKATGFEKVQNIIADKLHRAAEALSEKKAADQNGKSGLSQYRKQASEWLDQSAGYVRQFDYDQADTKVREYVKQSPGRSLLIAGAVGMIIGAILRRR